MTMRNRIMYLAAALIALSGLLLVLAARRHMSATAPQSEEPPVAAGDQAADFKLESLDGTTVSLDKYRGKVVFLNLWATWCGPCRDEMPAMETLYDDFKNNPDFVMLAVSQDTKGRQVVAPYVEKNGYHFTVLLDPENKVGELYDVSGVPETFVIDREGRIAAHHMGAFDWSRPDVKHALQDLLDAKDSKDGKAGTAG
jgi:peroxiredoxin